MTNELCLSAPELKSKDFYNYDWRMDPEIRDTHVTTLSWPILTSEAAALLASFIGLRRTLDAGAGTGFISHQLQNLGAKNIIASDLGDESFHDYGMRIVYKRDHVGNSLDLLPGDFEVVLLSWPPYKKDFGFQVVKKMAPGTILIYNGEDLYGCTGDDLFHEYLEKNFTVMENITASLQMHHVRFPGVYDDWVVYRKTTNEVL